MKYFQNLTQYTTENDPAGFKSPYLCGAFELEVLKSKYFRATNYSKNILYRRCNTIAYGGLTIRNEF
jgi:hypothetical protein